MKRISSYPFSDLNERSKFEGVFKGRGATIADEREEKNFRESF